jgi:hypothetical protein
VFRLTTPDELKALLGTPKKELSEPDGDSSLLTLEYPRVEAVFQRLQSQAPYTLFRVMAGGKSLDIGQDRRLTLRTVADLAKMDTFWGVAGVSLAGLDLTGQMARLNELPFDSRTQWPPADKLPKGFDPAVRKPGQPAWPPAWTYHSTGIATWDRVGPVHEYCEPSTPDELIRVLGTAHGEYLRERVERGGVWGAGLLGILFALSFCPMSAALFFGSLIPLAASGGSTVLMPSLYGIGTGLPVVLFAVFLAAGVKSLGNVFRMLTRIEWWARRVTGAVFVLVGVYFGLKYIFMVPLPF